MTHLGRPDPSMGCRPSSRRRGMGPRRPASTRPSPRRVARSRASAWAPRPDSCRPRPRSPRRTSWKPPAASGSSGRRRRRRGWATRRARRRARRCGMTKTRRLNAGETRVPMRARGGEIGAGELLPDVDARVDARASADMIDDAAAPAKGESASRAADQSRDECSSTSIFFPAVQFPRVQFLTSGARKRTAVATLRPWQPPTARSASKPSTTPIASPRGCRAARGRRQPSGFVSDVSRRFAITTPWRREGWGSAPVAGRDSTCRPTGSCPKPRSLGVSAGCAARRGSSWTAASATRASWALSSR